jgi:hypothetical protein
MGPWIRLQKNVRGGATQLERSLGRDRLDIGDAANAVRPKNLSVVAHPANSTSRSVIRKLEISTRERFPRTAIFGPRYERLSEWDRRRTA